MNLDWLLFVTESVHEILSKPKFLLYMLNIEVNILILFYLPICFLCPSLLSGSNYWVTWMLSNHWVSNAWSPD